MWCEAQAWSNGAVANAGAVTWGDGTTGIVGAVSAANSLVGTTASDCDRLHRRHGADQRQLCGAKPVLEQRRGGYRRGGHLGQRHDRGGRRGLRREQPGGHDGE